MSKIATVEASQALDLLRAAVNDVRQIFDDHGGSATYDAIAKDMRDLGWCDYDTRLSLSSVRAQITDDLLIALPTEVPYEI